MPFLQVPFHFPFKPSLKREDFLVAPCNWEAFELITHPQLWEGSCLILKGPKNSGKTHLAHLFSKKRETCSSLKEDKIPSLKAQKIVIEDIDEDLDEEKLFHLFNFIKETKGQLLLTCNKMPLMTLKDLSSRLNAAQKVDIGLPDDTLVASLFLKLFYDKQISISTEVIDYLVLHTERSFEQIKETVDKLDTLSLSANRKITIPLIKTIL